MAAINTEKLFADAGNAHKSRTFRRSRSIIYKSINSYSVQVVDLWTSANSTAKASQYTMNHRFLFAVLAVAVPLVAASYSPAQAPASYLPASANGLDELVQAATGGNQQAANAITGTADVQPTPAESARLGQIQAQLQALNANPTYQNLRNSEAIAESAAEVNLADSIRQGNINLVAPNVVDQGVFRSLLVPSGRNDHQVIATQPLPPIIVNQPGAPPQQVSSGPAAVVRAAPVIYKIRPSVIFQQEVINRVPTPLSLNPVYVKVYKPGRQINAPVAPVVQPVYNQAAPSYAPAANAAAASDSYSAAAPLYANPAPAPAYNAPAY